MNVTISAVDSHQSTFNTIASKGLESTDLDMDLVALLNASVAVQEKTLSNPLEFNKYVCAFTNTDIQLLFKIGHLTTYLMRTGEFLSTNAAYDHPHILQYFLVVIRQIVKQGALPWSLLSGKSFLRHMKELSTNAPPEMGLQEHLQELGEDSIALFEEILKKKLQISSMSTDSKEKISRLRQLHIDACFLEARGFPGAKLFIDDLQEEIEKEVNQLEQVERLYREMQSPFLSNIEQANLLDKGLGTWALRAAYMGHLIMHNDFQAISTYLGSLRCTKDCPNAIFQAICLEKVQNIELPIIKLEPAIESLAYMWNLYYQSPNCIFRNEKLFTLEQQALIEKLIQEKVITLLFSYMATAAEDAHSFHVSAAPSTPPSLHLITTGKTIFLPINVADHQIGLLITPTSKEQVSCSIFNTGKGIDQNHPHIYNGKKVQTVVRKHVIPINQLFNEEIWAEIHTIRRSKDVNPLYSVLLDALCANGEKEEASKNIHDYEAPQHTGTCIFQHMQALIRDQFMTWDHLGSKNMRYAAYRMIISDFALFIGDIGFSLDQNAMLFQAWEEKKCKLEAILSLANNVDRDEMQPENTLEDLCSLLDQVKNTIEVSNVFSNMHNEAFQHLKQVSTIYRKQLRMRAIQHMKEMPLEELPERVAVNMRRTDFGSEAFAILKERLEEHPTLMERFSQIRLINKGQK